MSPIITLTITLALIVASAFFYTHLSIYLLKGSAGVGKQFSFWGTDSWMRKYAYDKAASGKNYRSLIYAPKTWYYENFKIPFKEAFPGSATIFAMFTDCYSLMQWCFIKCIIAAVAINTKAPILIFFVLWTAWLISFMFFLKTYRNERD